MTSTPEPGHDFALEEAWQFLPPSPESEAQVDRMLRRARTICLNRQITSPEEVRTELLRNVDRHLAAAVDPAETAEVTQWRQSILNASDAELWAAYTAQHPR